MNFRGRNSRKKRIIAAIIVIVLALSMILSLAVSVSAAESISGSSIPQGLKIAGIDVGGMTLQQAQSALEPVIQQRGNANITFYGKEEDQQVTVRAYDLGMSADIEATVQKAVGSSGGANLIARYKARKDIEHNGTDLEPEITFNLYSISSVINANRAVFDREAKDATILRSGGSFEIMEGQAGYVINVEKSAELVYNALCADWDGNDTGISMVIDVDEPKGSSEDFAQMTDVIGTFQTSYSSSGSARCANIANACSLVNGTILYPGEQFSMLQTITPFSEENGYQLAASYMGDQVVESLGGGICQVSTTLYNAVIRAELQIDSRYNHSMIVSYVKPSMDAAIAESSGLDFKFTNNTQYPIYVEGQIQDRTITFYIYGKETRSPNRQIEFESETLTTTPPEGEKIYTDSSKNAGYISVTSGHTGYTARLWKIVREDGKEVSREVFNNSTYNMTPTIATVGTAGADENLLAAIATGSIETVKAAINGQPVAVEQTPEQQAVQAAAQEAASQAYTDAISSGSSSEEAMAKAQEAANETVNASAAAQTETEE